MNRHTSQMPVKDSRISDSSIMMEMGGRIASGIARGVLVGMEEKSIDRNTICV